ncbi:MAG: DUF1552 domain-containing protein [Myxococcota bacterium]|nr:DUF1552 domain-containing protein [Myxococcota bacterium]
MKRRHFLKLLGSAGAVSLCPPLVRSALAEGEAPKRLIVLSHCHGWTYDTWKLRPSGLSPDTPWSLDLTNLAESAWSQALAPLYRHRQRMIPVDGLSLATAELDMEGNRHDTGWVQAWTGAKADFSGTDTKSTAPSIDQRVALAIGRADRLPSLELSLDDARENGRPIAYGQAGVRLPVENDPGRAWDRLFGPSQAPDPLAAKRGTVLDFAHREFNSLAPRLRSAQRHKLESHYALVQSLTGRLEGMSSLQCSETPARPGPTASYDTRFDAMSELIATAFACDVTRVVSLSLGEMPTADFGAANITDDVHKGLAHEIYNNPAKHQAMTNYLAMHGSQVARLVDLLASLPDTDGQSIMDNTLIVWGSELADGWHGYQHYCPMLIGGSWYFRTGQYHYWPHALPIELRTPAGMTEVSGLPHQHLLVSVAHAMGLTDNHIGTYLIQSQNGTMIDCAGPLPYLT